MKPRVRPRAVPSTVTVVTGILGLGLLGACGPAITEVETDGDSEGSTGATTSATTTTPPSMTTSTPDPSVGSGDVTGEPGTTTEPTTTMPGDTTGGAGSDGCCEAHGAPGCNEEAVVDCVCAQEASCCAFEWAQGCVDLAMNECMAVCEDPGTTTDEPDDTTGEPMGACEDVFQIEMLPADATHSGAWGLSPSMVLPYEISLLDEMLGEDGSILYEPEIPCDDTWYIWVLYWEQGSEDSYFATLDGEPMPEAIFEGDCQGFGQGYNWRLLNWRDQAAMACEYVADPWAPDWTAGVHQIEFSYRESPAMGQILITNDEAFVPPPP